MTVERGVVIGAVFGVDTLGGMRWHWFVRACVMTVVGVGGAGAGGGVGNVGRWGDQGDGTFKNPVLPADYSDLDVIRVGENYYAISSTFQYSPGVVILRSGDLVNWTICG